jgi:hypothetical protein
MEGERGANSVKPKGYEPVTVYSSPRSPGRHSDRTVRRRSARVIALTYPVDRVR